MHLRRHYSGDKHSMARYMSCTRCKRQVSTSNWGRHESACYHTGQSPVWNKGLLSVNNQEIASSLTAGSRAFAAKVEAGFRPAVADWIKTPEQRAAKSAWRKQLHIDNPESHPNRKLAGNRSKMSYPEKLVHDFLVDKNVVFDHQKMIEGFYPDFVIGNQIMEVDGAKWHDADKDIARDAKLTAAGYKVQRFVIGTKRDLVKRVEEFLRQERLI
jgi:very-short-patch-repair endonuclease